MAKARERPAWYRRMKRTTSLKTQLAEILRKWPTDGTSTVWAEAEVRQAFNEWAERMAELPDQKKKKKED